MYDNIIRSLMYNYRKMQQYRLKAFFYFKYIFKASLRG